MPIAIERRSTTEDDITAEVLRRFETTPNERLREITLALVRHLHGFVKDVQLTEREWFDAIQFLNENGPDVRRQASGVHTPFGHPRRLDGRRSDQPVG
jgi:hypothetical protein